MAQTVIGIFDTLGDAENAVRQLVNSGFEREDIDISVGSSADYNSNEMRTDNEMRNDNVGSTADYGTTRSADSGSLNYGRTSADNDDSFGDKVGRFFTNLFDNDDEAQKYSTVARRGAILSLHIDSSEEAARAADILDTCGAINVDDRAKEYNFGSPSNDAGFLGSDRERLNPDAKTSIPVIEENLNVGKREVETGGMRLRSRIVERPIEESLRLREEHVRVERNVVDRPASDSDFETFKEGVIELTETSEVPVVSKEARVVEEVRLNKEVTEREEVIRDTVRRTDVEVEEIKGDKPRRGKSSKL